MVSGWNGWSRRASRSTPLARATYPSAPIWRACSPASTAVPVNRSSTTLFARARSTISATSSASATSRSWLGSHAMWAPPSATPPRSSAAEIVDVAENYPVFRIDYLG